MSRSALAFFIALLLASPVAAVTVAPLSFEQLVRGSSAVIFGRVIDVRAQWTEDRRHVESLVTVDVLKGMKGSHGEQLTLMVPGGQLGRYVNLIPGAPSLTPGDLAVFFLTGRAPRLPVVTGFTQGIYRVQRGGRSGELLVTPPPIDRGDRRIVRGDVRRKPVSLASFEAGVRAIADAAR
jgi:hypothetical protein